MLEKLSSEHRNVEIETQNVLQIGIILKKIHENGKIHENLIFWWSFTDLTCLRQFTEKLGVLRAKIPKGDKKFTTHLKSVTFLNKKVNVRPKYQFFSNHATDGK